MLPQFAADRAAKERFLREARAAARVKHDNVVTVYEADERNGVPYIAMEFLEGYPLDEFLKKKGAPSLAQTVRIVAETASGLAAAHKHGLVHRDIKPANLWLEAPNGRVKVLDFGLARPVDTDVELTKSGAIIGTPAYMSPEQARGERVDHRTDLFSLGAALYRLCTGKLPFNGPTTMAVLMALGTEEPKPVRELNPDVPESLAVLIHQLLAKRADDRPQSAPDVVKRLRAVAQELAAPRTQPQPAQLSASQPQRVQPPSVEVVRIPVTALTADNPFADIDIDADADTEHEPTPQTASKPARTKPGGTFPWALAGLAALVVAVAVAGVVIVIKNKDGTETRIEAPDGATVTVKDKGGKTLAQVGPDKAKPVVAGTDPDRTAAKYVLSVGGLVRVADQNRDFTAAADLPKGRFTLTLANLGGPQVTDAGLANFQGCTGLKSLDLGNAPVTDAGLAHFKGCTGLTHLNLGGCTKVTDAGLANFKDCKGLTALGLLNVPVTYGGLANFKDCKGLTALSLNGTRATYAGLAHFKDCKLTVLQLGDTQVTDAGLALFKDCKLTDLNVNGARPVTDAGLAHFKDCKLTALQLGDTKVTDEGLTQFKNCKELTILFLFATKVSDTGLAHFKGCTELTHLELTGVAVTDAGLAQFRDCKKLTIVDVRQTKLTAKGLADFHAAVPGCTIDHGGGAIEPKK